MFLLYNYCVLFVALVAICCHSCKHIVHQKNPLHLLSFVDEYQSSDSSTSIRLMDYPLPLHKVTNDSIKQMVLSAFINGQPLEFIVIKDSVISCTIPNQFKTDQYLKQFVSISEINPKFFQYRNISQSTLLGQFDTYLTKYFKVHSNQFNRSTCCEIRAGIISKFLYEEFNWKTAKMFFHGQLKWSEKNNQYEWSNHVVNVLPLNNKNSPTLMVFDPLSTYPFVKLDDYIDALIANGSIIQHSCLVNDDILSINFSSNKGLTDIDYANSTLLFNNNLNSIP